MSNASICQFRPLPECCCDVPQRRECAQLTPRVCMHEHMCCLVYSSYVEIAPCVGRSPYIEQHAAGLLTDPAVSVPRPKSTAPLATALALPLLLPPGISVGFLVLYGQTADSDVEPAAPMSDIPVVPSMEKANSSITAQPAPTAPAAASALIHGASDAFLSNDAVSAFPLALASSSSVMLEQLS